MLGSDFLVISYGRKKYILMLSCQNLNRYTTHYQTLLHWSKAAQAVLTIHVTALRRQKLNRFSSYLVDLYGWQHMSWRQLLSAVINWKIALLQTAWLQLCLLGVSSFYRFYMWCLAKTIISINHNQITLTKQDSQLNGVLVKRHRRLEGSWRKI